MTFTVITWVITVISIIGAVLNAQKKISGFYFWIVANTAWVAIDVYSGVYAQAALFLFYFAVCVYGLYSWRKAEA